MKKQNLLVLVSALLFTGCSTINNSNTVKNSNEETKVSTSLETGKVDQEEKKVEVQKLYESSLDTAEELDSFNTSNNGSTTEETPSTSENVPTTSEDIVTSEDVPTTSEDVTTSEETPSTSEDNSQTPFDDEKQEITSYHVDYTVDYALSVSLQGSQFYSVSEKQLYSLTYVKLSEEDIYLDLTTKYVYQETYSYMGFDRSETYSHEINLKYQDNYLYVTQKLGNKDAKKTKHNIDIKKLRQKYGDYFLYTSINAMFDPSSRENNKALVEELLTNESVKIVEVGEDFVTIEFDYEDGVATMVFNTKLNAFTSVTFDKSKEKEDVKIDDETKPSEDDSSKETPSTSEDVIIDNKSEEDTGFAYQEKHHHNDKDEDYDFDDDYGYDDNYDDYVDHESPFTIDDYTYVVNMNFSYNDQEAKLLTEEEQAEYEDFSFDYNHENNFHGKGDHGYHGGRDEHHHQDYYEPDYDYDFDDMNEYEEDNHNHEKDNYEYKDRF